jgi:hypothetical protein
MGITSKEYWRGIKRLSKLSKLKRKSLAIKRLPLIKDFCASNNITITRIDHGYQFRKSEYIINWCPSSNKVNVQYVLSGHNKTIPFACKPDQNKPKILIALESVVDVTIS